METTVPGQLVGSEIHGFGTMEDLDIHTIMEEAKSRWLRPNEIHAILCNYKYFSVNVKPVNLPKSGTIILFDRKKLRNFRKDGHNWKKKKDGKTVKEAHEHLKVGNEERIHVYYAHGKDNLTFVRRCYWLLDKTLEHIVLVHYRETQELQGSPATPVYSNSSSGLSDPSATWPLSEESDSRVDPAYFTSQGGHLAEANESMTIKSHEMRLHELNTLEWDDLVVPDDPNKLRRAQEGKALFQQENQHDMNGYRISGNSVSANRLPAQMSLGKVPGEVAASNSIDFNIQDDICFQTSGDQMVSDLQQSGPMIAGTGDALNNLAQEDLQTQDSFGRWMNAVIADSPGSVDDSVLESSISTGHKPFTSPPLHHNPDLGEIFSITDVSPSWAPSTEKTKILVVGFFHGGQPHAAKSNLFCVCGSDRVPVEVVQSGVFRCVISPQAPGLVNLYMSSDGHKPISQLVTFEFRAPVHNHMVSSEDKCNLEEFQVQMRLARLLFSTSKTLNLISNNVTPSTLKKAKKFARKSFHISDNWVYLLKSVEGSKLSFPQAKDRLFELTLLHRLREWLLERVLECCEISECDDQGQGAIHLCAILGYTWAVYPFAWSGLSLDYRDKFGWTALHWAAYYGREKMVATLLSAGAKSYLVTDPTSENHGGSTAADLASKNGYEGLAAYLAEKALVEHFKDMKLAGNAGGTIQTTTNHSAPPGNFSEEELYLKDSLAAYRTAADAAARIHAAFREHSLKLRTKAVQASNPEDEARNIIAAMKIQHAFRSYETRKMMSAAARIQYRFRTWKTRRQFLNLRRQAIKIQAAFRGFQIRKHYGKIVWSVGVLEKAILRWRLKRKGFRGLQVHSDEVIKDQKQDSDAEEDFFQASRKQAEERVERSVVKVQAMFRSKRAQEEYRRMKLAHNKALAEYEVLQNPDLDMG